MTSLFALVRSGWRCLLLISLIWSVQSADWSVTEVLVPADGRVSVQFPSQADSYYILYRGDRVTEIGQPTQLQLGAPASGVLVDLSGTAGREAQFYRVDQVLRSDPRDVDGDGLDDVYELTQSGRLDPLDARDAATDPDGDGRTVLEEFRDGTDPFVAEEVLTQFSSSPADGESDVAVTRETVLRFSRPLGEAAALTSNTLFASFSGRRILSRAELSSDRRTATLFYLEPLPGGARIRVSVDGSALPDTEGETVDADQDGIPGGLGRIEFETLGITPVGSTAVIGRVFASELVAGQAVNRPLAGVTITVDGAEETLRTVTDAQGNFRLQPAPAGTFFVHVDGRTAAGSSWPDGAYYPFVGKAWDAVAGREDNLAGGTGEIFLPLIRAGSLTAVSATEPTRVEFPAEVLAANPALAGVNLVVPPNALYADNGGRGGRVGIAPVSPDRLPEPLPPGMNFPLVITVQTDGGSNFDQPVPVTFPNLPDPVTGELLPPGAKSALWSFDHDLGSWVINGPMTVSADGKFVVCDPGTGIREPGWHGTQPGVGLEGGEIEAECEPTGCIMGPIRITRLGAGRVRFELESSEHTPGIVNWFAATGELAQGLSGDVVEFLFCEPGTHTVLAQLSPKCGDPCSKTVSITVTDEEVKACDPGGLSLIIPGQGFNVGESVSLDLLGLSGPIQGEVEWTVQGATPATGRGMPFNTRFCQPGEFEVNWKVTTPCGKTCTGVATIPVVGQAGCSLDPLQALNGPEIVVGETFNCVTFAHQEGEIVWEVDGGTLLLDPVQPVGRRGIAQFGAAQTIVFCSPGTKTVRARLTTACGQTCEQTINVTVRGEAGCSLDPLYTFETTTITQGDVINLTTLARQAGTVVWTAEGGTMLLDVSQELGTGGTAGVGAAQTIRFCTPGTKVITATLTTECGQTCQQTATITVTENPCNFSPFFDFGVSTIPAGDVVNLTTLAAVEGTFRWTATGGELLLPASQEVGLDGVAGFGAAQTILYRQPGNYVILGVLETPCGQECSREYRVTVTAAGPAPSSRTLLPPSTTLLRLLAGLPSLPTEAVDASSGSSPLTPATFEQPPARGATRVPTSGPRTRVSRADETPRRVRQSGLHYYVLVNRTTGAVVRRGFAGRSGVAHARPLQVGANGRFREIILQADSFWLAEQEFNTGESGSSQKLSPFVLTPPAAVDQDQDGLPDAAEFVVGTDPTLADSDGDGINDAEETRAGTASADSLGVIAAIDTPGHAVDVAVEGDRLALALRESGVATFNIFNGLAPVLVSQTDLPGTATAVAWSGSTLLVACREAGVAILDLADPTAPSLRGQLNLRSPVRSVATRANSGFAGLESGALVWIDLPTATESLRIGLGRPIEDLSVTGDYLYALTSQELHVISLAGGTLEYRGSISVPGTIGAGQRRLRLFTGGGLAYAVDTRGFRVIDLSLPDQPKLLRDLEPGGFGWKQLVPTGTGTALVAVDANSTDDGAHDVSLFDLQPGGTNAAVMTQIETPGLAEAVTLASGFAYVADGEAGLQVVRYLPRDSRKLAPTVTLAEGQSDGRVEENQVLTLEARVTDDVVVSRVEFWVDGEWVATDTSFPFELRYLAPARTATRTSLTVQARAMDTGGNRAVSSDRVLELVPDATAPGVIRVSPGFFARTDSGPVDRISLTFNEAIESNTLTRERLELVRPGADGQFDTADDVAISGGTLTYREESATALLIFDELLAKGAVQVRLKSGVRDLAGNARTDSFTWNFTVGSPRVVATAPANGGTSAGSVLAAEFNGPVDPATLRGQWTVIASGPDGRFGTADDLPQLGGAVEYDAVGRRATLTFPEPLPVGSYRSEIATGVADAAGNTLENTERWEFTVFRGVLEGTTPVSLNVGLFGMGQANEYQLQLPGGRRVSFFAPLEFGTCAAWTLVDPNGQVVFADANLCLRPSVITTILPGNYLLRAVSTSESGGRSRLTVSFAEERSLTMDLTNVTSTNRPSGSRVPGDLDVYQLRMPPGERFVFELTGDAAWTLRSFTGEVLFERERGQNQLETPDTRAGGPYQLEVVARSASGYQIRLTRNQTRRVAVDLTGKTTFEAQELSGSRFRLPGDLDLIDFTIPAGERWVFQSSSFFPCFEWSLRRNVGRPVFGPGNYCEGSGSTDLAGGVRTLSLSPADGAAGEFNFRATKVVERTIEADLRGLTRFEGEGELTVPGAADIYRLHLQAGQDWYFVSASDFTCLPWELRAPDGSVLFDSLTCDGLQHPVIAQSGVHELRIQADDNQTGSYRFALAQPGIETFTEDLTGRDDVFLTGDLVVPGSEHRWEFTAVAGDQWFLSVGPISGGGESVVGLGRVGRAADGDPLQWRLDEVGGATVVGLTTANFGEVFANLARAGTYRLTLTTGSFEVTRYQIRLRRVRSASGQWRPLPVVGGPTGPTTALLLHEDDVYVAGVFADGPGVGRLRNGVWTFLGAAARSENSDARVLTLLHDGTNVLAGGNFTSISGVPAVGVARWDGTAWSALAEGIDTTTTAGFNFEVRALAMFQGQLIAGGRFRRAGGIEAKNVARWDGTAWLACPLDFPVFGLTQGIGGRPANDTSEVVNALAASDTTVWIGGEFQFPGRNLASWNGSKILSGPGLQQSSFDGGAIFGLSVAGNDLLAVGRFTRTALGSPISRSVARWDGAEWKPVGGGVSGDDVRAIGVMEDSVWVGGSVRFGEDSTGGGTSANGLVRFQGDQWLTPQVGLQIGETSPQNSGSVSGLVVRGKQIWVVGDFTWSGGLVAPYVALWEQVP
ncbi:MAG: Ig-like domain-containing protein [Verrucomicrobia bacterium]|nr:Ig-like domain-containing protein [Verrucomicrobiota bacterium]